MIRITTRAGKKLELPIGPPMLHICDHATYHRGQLNSMIKLAGGTPSPVMVSMYCLAMGIGR
ncbi:MAG TPA: DinB family protein [Tepidisphaeraceae bacterium]|nr:DinB family protein [Tepidisphaeraceae bacterium]